MTNPRHGCFLFISLSTQSVQVHSFSPAAARFLKVSRCFFVISAPQAVHFGYVHWKDL